MVQSSLAPRLRRLPLATILGCEVRVATGFGPRLLGLAHLDLDRAGSGLLIPRCSSVHTFGMRFALDLYFLDDRGMALATYYGICPRRFVTDRGAACVLELPVLHSDAKVTHTPGIHTYKGE